MDDVSVYTGWMYRDTKPPNDNAFFENLTRCVFQSGLNWATIAKKWPHFRAAFEEFDIRKVASYGASDISRLMEDEKIIRNRAKILATIHNAREFERFSIEEGGFNVWLTRQDKSNNYQNVSKRLSGRFKHVGPKVIHIFLYSIGEDITYDESIFGAPKSI